MTKWMEIISSSIIPSEGLIWIRLRWTQSKTFLNLLIPSGWSICLQDHCWIFRKFHFVFSGTSVWKWKVISSDVLSNGALGRFNSIFFSFDFSVERSSLILNGKSFIYKKNKNFEPNWITDRSANTSSNILSITDHF